MPILTEEQKKDYFATQSSAANPLSPQEYLAKSTQPSTTPVDTPLVSPSTGIDAVTSAQEKMNNLAPPPTGETKKPAETSTEPSQGASEAELADVFSTEPSTPVEQRLQEEQAKTLEMKSELENLNKEIDSFQITDEQLNKQIQAITSRWDTRIADMQDINKRREKAFETTGYRLGSRFTGGVRGGVYGGVIAEEERQGVRRIGELEAQKQAEITAAKKAAQEQNWKVYVAKVNSAQSAYENQLEQVQSLNDLYLEEQKKITEQELKIKNETGITELFDQGITDPAEIQSLLKANGLSVDIETIDDVLAIIDPPIELADLPSDLQTFKQFFPDLDLETPEGLQTYLDFQQSVQNAKAKAPTDYTLSPGQVRYDAEGNVVASVPKETTGTETPAGALERGEVPFQATIQNAAGMEASVAGQQTAEKQMAQYAINVEYQSLVKRMEQSARKGLSADTRNELEKAGRNIPAAERMANILKEYQDAGGDMGFLKGKADKIARNIGTLATDPRFASIATEMRLAFQQYRQDMTGAAFGADESRDYGAVVPTSDKSFELNYAIIDGLKNYLNGIVNNTYSSVLGEGYANAKYYAEHPGAQQSSNGTSGTTSSGIGYQILPD